MIFGIRTNNRHSFEKVDRAKVISAHNRDDLSSCANEIDLSRERNNSNEIR
jgi:hypothetical protein